jgi:hypothetical protein
MNEFIKRIKVEHDDLGDKVKALRSFIGSEKFKTLSPDEQSLLKLQLRQMIPYLSTLRARLEFYSVLPSEEEIKSTKDELNKEEQLNLILDDGDESTDSE